MDCQSALWILEQKPGEMFEQKSNLSLTRGPETPSMDSQIAQAKTLSLIAGLAELSYTSTPSCSGQSHSGARIIAAPTAATACTVKACGMFEVQT